MFSESRNERRRRIGGRRSRQRRRDRRQLRRNQRQLRRNRQWRRRDHRYRRERDPMLNSVLNGDWSNSVPGRKIPEGHTAVTPLLNLLNPASRLHLSFSLLVLHWNNRTVNWSLNHIHCCIIGSCHLQPACIMAVIPSSPIFLLDSYYYKAPALFHSLYLFSQLFR